MRNLTFPIFSKKKKENENFWKIVELKNIKIKNPIVVSDKKKRCYNNLCWISIEGDLMNLLIVDSKFAIHVPYIFSMTLNYDFIRYLLWECEYSQQKWKFIRIMRREAFDSISFVFREAYTMQCVFLRYGFCISWKMRMLWENFGS